jgi:hypothetical protein
MECGWRRSAAFSRSHFSWRQSPQLLWRDPRLRPEAVPSPSLDPVRLLLVALPACRQIARVGKLPARLALDFAHAPSPLLITKAGSTPTFALEALCAVASFALVSLSGGIRDLRAMSTPAIYAISLSDCSKWLDGAE